MTACLAETIDPPFEILMPDKIRGPILFNSPHSGRIYPRAFMDQVRLDFHALRRSEDCFVDELVLGVLDHGVPLMRALFPRVFLDLNREPYELDPRMFDGRLPAFANTRSIRVTGGLGTIARVVGESQDIYLRRLTVAEGLARIETYYKPYHLALRRLMAQTRRAHGLAILVDCHSMPSGPSREEGVRADVVLGDRYATSCSSLITQALETELKARGYSVVRNRPYAGGYITEHYGNPSANLHAVQIEVNRALYMHEPTYQRSANFGQVCADFSALAARLHEVAANALVPGLSAAAE